ncbi:hypothetical protein [Microbacterium sp. cx-59]|nr:hypothetical protein [Microbacterium sp. cx-59]MCC4906981.1 hypothetical protein [Microbacterium sp. cx-59]
MRRQGPRHAGPRPHASWWRGPWPPSILLAAFSALLVWELSWALSLLNGG